MLARAIRREAAAHQRAAARAELERTLAQEANHRIKNDLQTAADLLLLGRPDGADGAAFDETAARIRSIATVHRLLTETEHRVDGGALLRSITAGAPVPVTVEAEPAAFDAATAQKLGIVANELVTNAFQHGAPPIVVRLRAAAQTRLRVDDSGGGIDGARRASASTSSGGWSSRVSHGRFELRALDRRRHARRGRLPDGRPMRVLVAEDDPLIALGLCERLRSLGHEPIGPAADGDRGDRARTREPSRPLPVRRRDADTSTASRPPRSSQTRACGARSSSSPASTIPA